MIISLKKTITNRKQHGNENNFLLVLEVFKTIREYYFSKLPDSQYDIKYVDKAIGTVCLECLRLEYDEIAVIYQQEIKEDVDELLSVGINAIKQGKYKIAIACLIDLQTIIEDKERKNKKKLQRKDFFQLIGMAAHIWSINTIAKKIVEDVLNNYRKDFSPLLKNSLKATIKEYSSLQDFETAQKIEIMMNERFF